MRWCLDRRQRWAPQVEPLTAAAARKLIREILLTGGVVIGRHARDEMKNDSLDEQDVLFVLRSGIVDEAEWEQGEWRHRVRAARNVAIVHIESERRLIVVTVWKSRR